jgi:hypothetical protein
LVPGAANQFFFLQLTSMSEQHIITEGKDLTGALVIEMGFMLVCLTGILLILILMVRFMKLKD